MIPSSLFANIFSLPADTCGDNCLMTQQDVFSWNYPGIGRSLAFMCIQGLVFFLVLFVVESDIINSIKMKLSPQVLLVDDDTSIHPSNSNLREDDDDVSEEKSNVLKLDHSELASDDNILVLKRLTKRYSGNFLAVNKLCLKVRRMLKSSSLLLKSEARMRQPWMI